jgi:Bacterial SH3 domain
VAVLPNGERCRIGDQSMKRVLLSLLVLVGILYPAYTYFTADDEPKPAAKGAVGEKGAVPASPQADVIEEAEAAQDPSGAEAMARAAPNSPHAIVVEQAPSQAQAEARSQVPAERQPQAPSSSSTQIEGATPSTPSAEASPDATPNRAEFMKVTSPASVREGPSVSSKIIGIAHPGAEAQVVSRDSDWVQIIDPSSNKTGWIHQSFLETQGQPSSRPASREEIDAALAAPVESKTASADRRAYSKSKSHKRGWKHKRHRRGFALGFFRRVW